MLTIDTCFQSNCFSTPEDVSDSECGASIEANNSFNTVKSSATTGSQPPRKRYQRVGLFSDFYKDDE